MVKIWISVRYKVWTNTHQTESTRRRRPSCYWQVFPPERLPCVASLGAGVRVWVRVWARVRSVAPRLATSAAAATAAACLLPSSLCSFPLFCAQLQSFMCRSGRLVPPTSRPRWYKTMADQNKALRRAFGRHVASSGRKLPAHYTTRWFPRSDMQIEPETAVLKQHDGINHSQHRWTHASAMWCHSVLTVLTLFISF